MEELMNKKKTVMISSITEAGQPFISYAPYVLIEDYIYIYISRIAEHYSNLENQKVASIMILEDEQDSPNLFARNRLSFECSAERIEDDPKVFDEFSNIHGQNMMSVLQKMDFNIFKLSLHKGRLVKGFGQAFDVYRSKGEWKLEQVTGDGHKK